MLETILFLSVAAQVILLFHGPWTMTLVAGVISLSLLVAVLWNGRTFLPAHSDMVILMAGLGGLGMALATPHRPLCHDLSLSEWTAMTLGMFVFSLPVIWHKARCFAIARANHQQWTYLVLHCGGMLLGMYLGMTVFHRLPAPPAPQMPLLHHLFMLLGMLLFMPPPRVVTILHDGLLSLVPMRHQH